MNVQCSHKYTWLEQCAKTPTFRCEHCGGTFCSEHFTQHQRMLERGIITYTNRVTTDGKPIPEV